MAVAASMIQSNVFDFGQHHSLLSKPGKAKPDVSKTQSNFLDYLLSVACEESDNQDLIFWQHFFFKFRGSLAWIELKSIQTWSSRWTNTSCLHRR
jgi:hypothetical protein